MIEKCGEQVFANTNKIDNILSDKIKEHTKANNTIDQTNRTSNSVPNNLEKKRYNNIISIAITLFIVIPVCIALLKRIMCLMRHHLIR